MTATQPGRRRRIQGLVAGIAVLVLVAAGILVAVTRHQHSHRTARPEPPATAAARPVTASATPSPAATTASGPVTVADGGTVTLSDGTSVAIPAGAVSTDTTLTLTHDGAVPASPDTGLTSAGQPVHIELADGQLTGTASISIPVTPPADTPAGLDLQPLLAYYDDTDQSWTAVEATYNSTAQTVTADVDHFSWWNPFTWN